MVPTWLRSGDSGKEVPSPHCLSSGVTGSVNVPETQRECGPETEHVHRKLPALQELKRD